MEGAELTGIKEKGRAVWGKVSGSLETGMDQAQVELGKLQQQAAQAPESSRARIYTRIGETRARQEADQEKLRSSLAQQIADADVQIADLEAAAMAVSGEAHEKIVHDADEVRAQRGKAQQRLVSNLEVELAEAQSEMATLQKEAADAPPDAADRIMMRATWAKARRDALQERLAAVRQQVSAS